MSRGTSWSSADHYAEAMRLLNTLSHYDGNRDFPSDPTGRAAAIAKAQVHATLALVAHTESEVPE